MHELSRAPHAPTIQGVQSGARQLVGDGLGVGTERPGRTGCQPDRRSGAAGEPARCAGHRHAPARWRRPPVSRGDRSGGAARRGGGRVWVWT
jgi:hypothetical protein